MKKSTKVIASSVLSIAMCATLITGSTFALFTGHDEENISVTSGNVEVKARVDELKGFSAEWKDDGYVDKDLGNSNPGTFTNKGTWKYDTGDGAGKLELTNISPGDGVKFNLSITNTSTIKIQYRAQLVVNADEETDPTRKAANKALLSAMKVTIGEDAVGQTIGSSSMIATKWTMVETIPGKESPATYTVPVRIELPITNADQNAYQGAKCSFSVGVYAIQANANVSDPPTGAAFIIYTPQDFVSLSEEVNGGNTFEKETVALANDIYLDGSASRTAARLSAYVLADALADTTATTFAPIGTADHPFKGTFDGHGHTIYNFTAQTSTEGSSNAGLFGVTEDAEIKDVTFANATVEAESGTSAAGVLVGTAKGSLSVSNVTVKESTVTAAEEGANLGALVGKTEGGATVTVENVNVQMNESDAEFNGKNELVGGENPSVEFTGGETNEAVFELYDGFIERITYTNDGTQKQYEVSSAEGLRYFAKTVNGDEKLGLTHKSYAGETVVLMNDIDLKNEGWLPIGTAMNPFKGTFTGAKGEDENYAISNLSIESQSNDTAIGLFGFTKGATLTNLTLNGVKIKQQKCAVQSIALGALVGNASNDEGGDGRLSTISHISLTGFVDYRGGGYGVGGICGRTFKVQLSDIDINVSPESMICYNVTWSSGADYNKTSSSSNRIGGVVGWSGASTYTDITTNLNVVGNSAVGGVVGLSQYSETFNRVTVNAAVTGDASAENGDMPQGASKVGAIVGCVMNNDHTFENIHFDGTIYTIDGFDPTYSYKVMDPVAIIYPVYYGLLGQHEGTVKSTIKNAVMDLDLGEGVNHIEWDAEGNIKKDAENAWVIASTAGLMEFRDMVNGGASFENVTVSLLVDIDLKDVANWTPIGNTSTHPFKGNFVGVSMENGEVTPETRTISNMTIAKTGNEEGLTEDDDKKFAAFFAFTQNAAISNLHFVKANVTNTYTESDGAAGYCAVLVGRTNGGKLEISNVTIGEKFENTEAGKLAHEKEEPYVTSGKAVAAFVSRSTGDGSITFDNCVNYANLCAPKAAGFIAQFQSSANTPLTIKNSANYGNITMPQSKDVLCDKPDVVMGGFIGYIQSSSEVLLVNCVNEGNIDATITQVKKSVNKLNVGGLISSVHDAAGKTTLVDCINRGNVVVNQSLTEGTACDGEIGGLIGSTGATMYHVEQLGDITVTNTSTQPMHVGGVVGAEDKGDLKMYARSEYVAIAKAEDGAERNFVKCLIQVNDTTSTDLKVGAATGSGTASEVVKASDFDLCIKFNDATYGKIEFPENNLYGLNGATTSYYVSDTQLKLSITKEGDFSRLVTWSKDEPITVTVASV